MASRNRPGFSADLEGDRPGLPAHLARVGHEKGMSQAAMAGALGIEPQALLNIRRNRRSIDGVAEPWAKLVGVDLNDPGLERSIYYELLAAIDLARGDRADTAARILMLDDVIRYVMAWGRGERRRERARRTK